MSESARGHLAMLAFSALIAGSFSLGGLMANMISPTAFSAARFLLAATCVGTAALATGQFRPEDARAPWRYLLLGLCLAAYFVLMFEGLKTAPPVSTAAVFTLTPILSAGFGWLLLRQVTTPRIATALAIGGAGAVWVIFRADLAALLRFQVGKGEITYFWGCLAHALYTPLVRKLNKGESPVVFSFGVLVTGFLLLTLWGWSDIVTTAWSTLPAIVWISLLYTAIIASAVTFVLLQYAALRLPSSKVMAYTYLTPSWVILWEIALGKPVPSGLILLGVAATIAALAMLVRE
ncbi:MAG: DMT family transporter [Paracoccaceae bacterium]|jgi:drug/metabolite transporter (DMT)-like permease